MIRRMRYRLVYPWGARYLFPLPTLEAFSGRLSSEARLLEWSESHVGGASLSDRPVVNSGKDIGYRQYMAAHASYFKQNLLSSL